MAQSSIKIGVAGALGRMGRTVAAIADARAGMVLTALFDRPGMEGQVVCGVALDTRAAALQPAAAAQVLVAPAMLRLDLGVFVLYAAQIAMWVAVPALLVRAGLDKPHHWQVYLPAVNWILFATIVVAVGLFRNSTNLASAYGIAVTTDMLITTVLTFFVIHYAWKLPLWLCVAARRS